jgi:hypothetical protein
MIEQAKKEADTILIRALKIGRDLHQKITDVTKEHIEILDKLLKEYDTCLTCKSKGSAYDDETGVETCPDCRRNGEIK